MNYEHLAFFNQQLAGMLKSGLPLEGALKQLSASMARGALRAEVEALEADLEQGVSLDEALGRRRFPEMYTALLRAGIRGNDLPGVLGLAADHYQQVHQTWQRLKGLMVYPALVLLTAFFVSILLGVIYTYTVRDTFEEGGVLRTTGGQASTLAQVIFQIWFPAIFTGLLGVGAAVILCSGKIREWLLWKLPAFREANLSRFGSTMAVLLGQGVELDAALRLVEAGERSAPVRGELAGWRARLAGGTLRLAELAGSGRFIPPLFVWLVASAGEEWAHGFRRAAEVYDRRARHRTELLLYTALPMLILFLAGLVVSGLFPVVRGFAQLLNVMSDFGDM